MRNKHLFGAVCLVLGLTCASPAQQVVNPLGSVSGQTHRSQNIDTSNLSTPMPTLPYKRRFTLGNLIPSWLIPAKKPAMGNAGGMAPTGQ